jgi:Right handed beta helix region
MRRLALFAAPIAVLGLVAFSSAGVRAGALLVVDDNHAQCPTATYTTISAAVTAASAGDTIQVCAGIYPETVTVDKSLTIEGAKMGVDARTNRGGLATESVVDSINGGFIIDGGVNNVTIDGFTIEGAGSDSVGADGVEAFQGSSGLSLLNNIVRDNLEGINFQNPDGTMPALIEHNNFINNNNGTTAEGGTGVFISSGPANSTSILANRFSGHRQTAINFAGNGSNHSTGLVVDGNQSSNDSTFVVATDSDNALIENNTINYSGSTNGTAILDFGSNNDLRILSNVIKGGSGSGTSGIKLADFTGSPSVGTTVTGNKVSGRYWGIRVVGAYTSALINGNNVTAASSVGILIDNTGGTGTSSGNVITHNKVSGTTGTYACEDMTTGSLTAGTANTWSHNTGGTAPSSPTGICTQS